MTPAGRQTAHDTFARELARQALKIARDARRARTSTPIARCALCGEPTRGDRYCREHEWAAG